MLNDSCASTPRNPMKLFHAIIALFAVAASGLSQGSADDYRRAAELSKVLDRPVYRSSVDPHWDSSGTAFWYMNQLADEQREFVSINALNGERTVMKTPPADAQKPIQGVSQKHPSINGGVKTAITLKNTTKGEVRIFWINAQSESKPYGSIKPGQSSTIQTFSGHVWSAEDGTGKSLGYWDAKPLSAEVRIGEPLKSQMAEDLSNAEKPVAPFKAFIRDFNVWVSFSNGAREYPVSATGTKDDAFEGPPLVSRDGKRVVALQRVRAQEHPVHMVSSTPKDQIQPALVTHNYLKAGDAIAKPRPRLFDVSANKIIPIAEELFSNPWDITRLEWAPDSSYFRFLYNERGHQRMRVLAVDATTGVVRTVIEESSPTFIDYSQKTYLYWGDGTGEVIWMSERDGWNHLWLYDARTGSPKNQITSGEWVVRKVCRVDEEKRQIWFECSGIYPNQDPYHIHLARVNFDGTGLRVLTAGDGTHVSGKGAGLAGWNFSPDARWFIATYSRVDLPPVTELRRSDDGALVCELERADASEWTSKQIRIPTRFSAKARDGITDIYGVLIAPTNFDVSKKYPVLENIYAGPHGAFVPKQWGPLRNERMLAELGFIVVRIDGMGTNWRSRAFHDVAWKNLKDAGFPDRIAWLKAAAERYPQLDLTRVGIFGGSAGGQNALAALLHHGDFYRAAAADCGCHDNRMDKIWWNEAWMGWPVGPEYAHNSNVTHAAKLQGKLLLTVGELDRNVDPASTMQVVKALIDADKDFELIVAPGAGHGAGELPYLARRRADFFVRHLMGVDPRGK